MSVPTIGGLAEQTRTLALGGRMRNRDGGSRISGKMRRKADLPTKVCAACRRPFAWRKRWAKMWYEVKYCSDACRRAGSGKA